MTVTAVRPDSGGHKAHGMTHSVKLEVECDGQVRDAYLKTPRESLYGEDLAADNAREVTWRLEGYPTFAGHVRCAAVGRWADGEFIPMSTSPVSTWVLEWAQPGQRYADRISELDTIGADRAAAEARILCRAMVGLHQPVPDAGIAEHRRAIRDALIVPTHRLIDSADTLWARHPRLRTEMELACARWRQRLSERVDRLRYVHHDFHPWNVFLEPSGGSVHLIGARFPGIGDPYDDFAAFAINYLWFCHSRHGAVLGAYRAGFEAFRDEFLATGTVDADAGVLSPFVAKRLLVLLNPTYYPSMPTQTAAWLLDLLCRCLRDELDLLGRDAVDQVNSTVEVIRS